MKKIILRYGFTGGFIMAAELIATTIYTKSTGHEFEHGMVIGYASMILAFSFIFIALKHLRDKQYGGAISFGKAFKAALLITLVTATFYVITWLVCYYFFIPDFMERYTAYTLNAAKEQGLSAEEIAKQTAQLKQYSDMYKNPLFVVLLTYMEILPVGLLVSLIASLIIKRKTARPQPDQMYSTGTA